MKIKHTVKAYSEMSDDELKENNIVKINDSSMIWNIHPSVSPRKNGSETLIRLSWGMFTDYHVDTDVNMAKLLIYELTNVINEIESQKLSQTTE